MSALEQSLRRDLSDARRTIDAMVRERGLTLKIIDRMIEGDLVPEGETFTQGVKQGWNTALVAVRNMIRDGIEKEPEPPSLVEFVDEMHGMTGGRP